jgi:hypothetical protein
MTPEKNIEVRQQAAVWREVDGETVLLDLSSASYLGMNSAGSLLWTAITQGTNRSRLVALLVDRFALEHDRATHDVDEFLATCRERGLIK